MTSGRTVRPATTADINGMSHALSLAFQDDPVFAWLFGGTDARALRYGQAFFAQEGARHLRHEHVFTIDDTPGAAYWDPPGQWKTAVKDLVRMTPLIVRGMRSRTLKAFRGLSRLDAAHAKQPEHYYLAILGTRPDRQGEGLGSALMAPMLARCDAEGVGAYLESSKESNIPYYRRYGFEVVGEVEFPSGPKLWPMWRDPRAPE